MRPQYVLLLFLLCMAAYAYGQELSPTEYFMITGLRALEEVPYVGHIAAWGVKFITAMVMTTTAITTVIRPFRKVWCKLSDKHPDNHFLANGCPKLAKLYCFVAYFSAYNVDTSDIRACSRQKCALDGCLPPKT